jgi:hypothetical protein
MDDLLATQIERLEIDNTVSGKGTTWTFHVVSPPGDPNDEIKVWGDLSTDDPAIAAQFEPGQRWTLSRG